MKNILKKTFVFLIAFALIAQASLIVPSLTIKTYADTEVNTDYEEGSDLTVLAFTSDVHNLSANHLGAQRLATWIDNVYSIYGQQIEVMGFCGDMADSQGGANYWNLVQEVMDGINVRTPEMVGRAFYTTGNHEYDHKDDASIYTHDLNDTTRQFIEDQPAIDTDKYHIYCVGTGSYVSEGENIISIDQINALSEYLNSIEDDKPIIILNHYPLHYNSSRTIRGADMMIEQLNSAAQSGKKIVFLWGHNHMSAPRVETYYDEIFKPGDSIVVASGQSEKIKFYYAAAGCMCDDEYYMSGQQGSGYIEGKGLTAIICFRLLITMNMEMTKPKAVPLLRENQYR